MKTPLLTLLATLAPALSHAFDCEAVPLRVVVERSAEMEGAVSNGPAKPASPVLPRVSPPVPSLIGATIGRGVFANDFDVKWPSGDTVGRIKHVGGGYIFETAAGVIAAAAGGLVTDGQGTQIGKILENSREDCGSFTVYDAKDVKVAETGCIDRTTFDAALAGEPRAIVKNDHWLKDRYKITAISSGLDHRLVAMLVVMNNAAIYRRSERRERERRMDRPGRDHVGNPHYGEGGHYGYNGRYPNGRY